MAYGFFFPITKISTYEVKPKTAHMFKIKIILNNKPLRTTSHYLKKIYDLKLGIGTRPTKLNIYFSREQILVVGGRDEGQKILLISYYLVARNQNLTAQYSANRRPKRWTSGCFSCKGVQTMGRQMVHNELRVGTPESWTGSAPSSLQEDPAPASSRVKTGISKETSTFPVFGPA